MLFLISVPKPFVEVSIVKRLAEHSIVDQFKYFAVLIQEFHVKVDIGFVNAMVKFLESKSTLEDDVNIYLFIFSNDYLFT